MSLLSYSMFKQPWQTARNGTSASRSTGSNVSHRSGNSSTGTSRARTRTAGNGASIRTAILCCPPRGSISDNLFNRYFTNNNDSTKKSKRILHDRVKQRFLRLEILCAEYAALERKQEEDLFSRVQLGVPLTPAEKLRASSGAWQAFAVDIERQYPELMDSMHYHFSFQSLIKKFHAYFHLNLQLWTTGVVAVSNLSCRSSNSFSTLMTRALSTMLVLLPSKVSATAPSYLMNPSEQLREGSSTPTMRSSRNIRKPLRTTIIPTQQSTRRSSLLPRQS